MKRYLESIKLCFAYYKQPLCLKDISFVLPKNKNLLVLGQEDSGKTTLLKALSGFDKTYFGEIRFKDQDIKKINDEDRCFSLIMSEPVLLNGTIRKNFDFLCDVLKVDRLNESALSEVLSKFKIDKPEITKIKELSLLEKRKLALARAFIKNPNIWFIDDQFVGLTEDEMVEMQEVLNVIFKIGSTIIIASGGSSFVKNSKFYKNIAFEEVLYLAMQKGFKYKSIDEFESKKINFGVIEFVDTHKVIDGFVIKKEGAYFFGRDEAEDLIKFNAEFYDKLSLLTIVEGESENVKLCISNKIDFEKVNDREFNKYLELGDFIIYSELDNSRVI